MKAFAARDRDVEDLLTLAKLCDVSTLESAVQICARFFPGQELSPRSQAMLEDLFA